MFVESSKKSLAKYVDLLQTIKNKIKNTRETLKTICKNTKLSFGDIRTTILLHVSTLCLNLCLSVDSHIKSSVSALPAYIRDC